VVGVDGSPGSRSALVWALADAARREAVLVVLATFPVEVYWGDPHLLDDRHVVAVRTDTEARVRALVEELRGTADVVVEVEVAAGPPAARLVEASGAADLLVVGSRGRGAVRSTVLGSVALHCVTHASCPVVVVHPLTEAISAPARVVVGMDGSAGSVAALARAIQEATLLAGEVVAVAAYSAESYWSDAYEVVVPPIETLREDVSRNAGSIVADVVDAASPGAPPVLLETVEGAAGEVLVRRSAGATLLVVGGHGRGALRGMLLGSVALHCVLHASCPVLVVRPS